MYEINGNLVNIEKYNVFNHMIAMVMSDFHQMFGLEIMSRYPLYIDNCNNEGKSNCGYTPIITPILKQLLIIKLGIDDFGNAARIVYQLSHELCHYVFYSINGIAREKIDDEEESVCSAMALIMLKKYFDNVTFESYCNHVKELSSVPYRNGFFLAEILEFKTELIVKKILKR